eukprot:COSAG02_NODE_1060_length_14866_cov_3.131916_10_plen_127_part_00
MKITGWRFSALPAAANARSDAAELGAGWPAVADAAATRCLAARRAAAPPPLAPRPPHWLGTGVFSHWLILCRAPIGVLALRAATQAHSHECALDRRRRWRCGGRRARAGLIYTSSQPRPRCTVHPF